MTLLQRLFAWFRRSAEPRSAVVEEVEPRILYSADLNPALWAGDATAMVADLHGSDAAAPLTTAEQQQGQRHEIVFVDAAVPDAQKLIDGVLASRAADTQIEIVQIHTGEDGLAQIANVLSGEHDLNAIHIISHGGPGELALGNGTVDARALRDHGDLLAAWRGALTEDADILLYGCNVAEGAAGQSFVAQLSSATGADVAASDDKTGDASLGGDWDLEHRVGAVETAGVVGADLLQGWGHVLAVAEDATSSGTAAASASSATVSHTTSGNDRLMLVGISFGKDDGNSVASVTYNGVALTKVGSIDNSDTSASRVEIWRLVAPLTGTHNVVVNFSGTSHEGAAIGVMTFTGVDQSTPLGTFASAQGSSTTPSVTVTSAANELVFGVAAYDDSNDGNFAPGAGQTEKWDLFGGITGNGGGTTEAGAASVVTSWTIPSSYKWAAAGVSIKPFVNTAPVAANDAYAVNEDSTLVVAPSTANLANWWGFNEGGSTQTISSSGSLSSSATRGGTAGVDASDPTWTTGYVGGSALAFNGAGQYVETTSTNLKTASNFTLSAWFQTNTTTDAHHLLWAGYPGGNGYGNGGSTTAATSELSLSIGGHTAVYDNKIVFFLGYDLPANGADSIFIVSASDFTDTGNWHQVAVTVTDLGGGVMQASLYVDGKLEGTDTGSENDRSVWGALRIGAPGDGSRSFNGKIDEVRVYDTALAPASIQALAQAGVLANDTDVDSPVLKVVTPVVSGPTNGTLSINADGSFSYTPNANFFGTDSFTYRANDGTVNSNVATVTITVNPVNDAPTLTATALNPSFTEAAGLGTQAAPVSVFSGAAASTVESGQTLTGLTFTVSGLVDGANEVIVVDGRTITLGTTSSGTTATNALAYDSTVSGGTATVVLSGGALTPALLQGLVNGITYQNTRTDDPTAGNRIITLTQVKDSGGTANGGVDTRALAIASTVAVNGVNDEPQATNLSTAETYTEDTPLNLTDVAASDVDGGSVTAALTLSNIAAGSLNTGSSGAVLSTYSAGTGVWTATGAIADVNALLAGLTFTPTANFNGSFTIATSISDGVAAPVTGIKAITGTAVADTPSVTPATTNEDTQTASGLVISRNAADSTEVTHFQITGISNGTLYQNNGTTVINNGDFITAAQGGAGLKFTPSLNSNANGSFTVQASTSNVVGGLGGGTVNATITVTPVANTPSVTPATTDEDTQTTSGLVISRNAADGAEVTHFQITGITNGTLYQNNGTTAIANGDFITFAQGNAGLKFTPTTGFSGSGSFTVQASISNGVGGLGGGTVNATITVNAVNAAPTLTASALNPIFTEAAGLGTQAAAVSVFSSAAASTIESGQTISGLTFTVGGLVDGANEVIVVDGRTITLGATGSGTTTTNGLAYNSTVSAGTATIVLSGGALSAAATQTLIDTITYQNTNTDNPTAGNRIVTLTEIKDSGGTANGGVDTTALSIASTVTVTAVNDAASLSSDTRNLSEGNTAAAISSSGTLTISDVDSSATFVAQAGTAGSYGTFAIDAAGAWTYTAGSAHDEFQAGVTYTDTFNVASADGTPTSVTINILGTNDAAVLSADVANLTETNAAIDISSSGTLTISDVDSSATFVAQAATAGTYGSFSVDAAGAWTYTASSAHDEFVAGTTYTDTFNVASADSTLTSVTINILGTNDAALLSSDTRNLTEGDLAADISTSGNLTVSDVDSAASFVAQAATAGSYGTFAIDAAGAWTYTASSAHDEFVDGVTYTDTFNVASADGMLTSVTISILGTNDAAVITSDGGGPTATIITAENQTAVTVVTSIDVDGATPLYSIAGGADAALFSIDSATGALAFISAPDFEAPGDTGADNIYDVTVQVADGYGGYSTQALAITLTGVNEAPAIAGTTGGTVSAGASAGTLVATVSATDPDSGAVLTFDLLADAGGRFVIDPASGRISVADAGLLGASSGTQQRITVRVSDASGASDQRELILSVQAALPDETPAFVVPAAPAPEPPPEESQSQSRPTAAPSAQAGPGTRERAAWREGDPSRAGGDALPSFDEVRASTAAPRYGRDGGDEGEPIGSVSFGLPTLAEIANQIALVNESSLLGSIDALLRNSFGFARGQSLESETAEQAPTGEDRRPSTLVDVISDPMRISSVSFTAGFVWWLTRGGGLLATMLMSLPAWRHIDLLPVLARRLDDEDDNEDDDFNLLPLDTSHGGPDDMALGDDPFAAGESQLDSVRTEFEDSALGSMFGPDQTANNQHARS